MHSVRVRRAFVLAVLFAVLTFASPPAHAQSVRAPVGPWIVYIGRIRIVYSFTNEGLYYYKNTNDYAAGSVEEERGRYSVVNNIIVLLPNGGFPRKLRWQIGSELGKPILFLSDEYGYQQKFYYGE